MRMHCRERDEDGKRERGVDPIKGRKKLAKLKLPYSIQHETWAWSWLLNIYMIESNHSEVYYIITIVTINMQETYTLHIALWLK